MELIQIYVTFSKMAASVITENSKNIKQTISHELPNGFCQNMCHTDANVKAHSRCDIAFCGLLVFICQRVWKTIKCQGKVRENQGI